MVENLQDELHQLEHKQKKVLNLVVTSDEIWRAKNVQKLFSKYL